MRHLICAAIAALAVGTPIFAQSAESAEVSIRFQVSGIEEDSIAAVVERLKAIPAVAEASFDPAGSTEAKEILASGYFVVSLAQGHQLTLAEIEKSLASAQDGATLDRGSVLLAGNCRLVFEGVSSRDDQDRLIEAIGAVTGLEATSSGELGTLDVVATVAEPSASEPQHPAEGPSYDDEERKAMEELRRRAEHNIREGGMAARPPQSGVDLRLVMISVAKQADGESSPFELQDVIWSAATID